MTKFCNLLSGWLFWTSCVFLALLFWVILAIIVVREETQSGQTWIKNWNKQIYERNRLLQREIYLREELQQLKKQEDIKQNDDTTEKLQRSLDLTIRRQWLCKQGLKDLLVSRDDAGPLVSKLWANKNEHRAKPGDGPISERCIARGGCCERGCGCCSRPRRIKHGEQTIWYDMFSMSKDIYAHCTEECGCCRRYWGFRSVEQNGDGTLTTYDL